MFENQKQSAKLQKEFNEYLFCYQFYL